MSNVEVTAHAIPVFNVFREDEPRDWFSAEEALSNAPQKANGLLSSPKSWNDRDRFAGAQHRRPARLLQRREVSPLEVLESLHERIAKVDPQIDAYLSLDFEQAKKEAEKVDVNLPLGGVPIAIKDIISVAGQPCTCASKMLRNYRALYDATVIRKLRAAGAIPFRQNEHGRVCHGIFHGKFEREGDA